MPFFSPPPPPNLTPHFSPSSVPDWLLLSTSQSTLSPLHKHPPPRPDSPQPLIANRRSPAFRLLSDMGGWGCWGWLERVWGGGGGHGLDCLQSEHVIASGFLSASWSRTKRRRGHAGQSEALSTVWRWKSDIACFFFLFVFFFCNGFTLFADMLLLFYPDKHIVPKKGKEKPLLLLLILIMATSQITHCILTPPAGLGLQNVNV